MAGKTRPSLRAKTLQNVALSNLSFTDKECIEQVFSKFEELATADVVEVKHGEWILEHETYGKMLCSSCKEEALIKYMYDDVSRGHLEYVKSPYCPHCSAKMDGKPKRAE